MRYVLPLLTLTFLVVLAATIVRWAFVDARQRGRAGWLVALLVVALPFLGWLLWLAMRTPLTKEPTDRLFAHDESWKSGWALLWCFALAWYNVGVVWLAQLVIYPLKAYVGAANFIAYDASYAERIAAPVVLVFELLLCVTLLLVWFRPRGVPTWAVWTGIALELANVASTIIWEARIQVQMGRTGFSQSMNERLILTNWTRTTAFTLHGILVLWMVARVMLAARDCAERKSTRAT